MRNETSSGAQSFISIASIANIFGEILWGSVTILAAVRVAYWLFLLIE